jgi:hypothetical protein
VILAASCSGFSATTSWAVEQFGLAMMFFLRKPSMASGFTSGTISGTSGCWRQAEELSITTAPALPIFSAQALDTSPPADISTMSTWEKSKVSMSSHLMLWSPRSTSSPSERREATAWSLSTGNFSSSRITSISRPTLPVAPTMATR